MTRPAQSDFWQRRTRRTPPPLEVRTHCALADLLRIACKPGWFWSHIGHGGYRTAQTAALLQRMGLRRGLADFLFIAPDGRHCWLELKRGSAPLTADQQAFAEHLRQGGVPHFVARDFDSAVAQLKQWGAL
jgi:hypothetical protein